jgi:endonuclease G
MTNNHVFGSRDDAESSSLQFNYELQEDRVTIGPVDAWDPDPDRFITNPALDYAIVGVKPKDGKIGGDTWGFFNLDPNVRIRVNQRANIIQHPQGRTKEIAFRGNPVKFVDDTKVQYLTDTDYGTSGSAVLNDRFQVVALHNQRVPDPADPNRWYRNQGYRIKAILADVGNNMP